MENENKEMHDAAMAAAGAGVSTDDIDLTDYIDVEHGEEYGMVRVNTAYLDIFMEALKYPTPKVQAITGSSESNTVPDDEMRENIRKKLYENDGTSVLTMQEVIFAYDAVHNYKKILQKELPKAKKGSAQYNKTKKALDAMPQIINTFFGGVEIYY